jgi:hypothetical protein
MASRRVFAFGDAAAEVVAGAGIPAQSAHGDAVERGVGVAITSTIDSLGRCGCQGGVLGGLTAGFGGVIVLEGRVASCPAVCRDFACLEHC